MALKSNPAKTIAWQRRSAKPLPKIGKKGAAWRSAFRAEKAKLIEAGITRCECGYDGCWKDNAITPAHSLKRRNITSEALLREFIWACITCHETLEAMGEEKMSIEVRRIISMRNNA